MLFNKYLDYDIRELERIATEQDNVLALAILDIVSRQSIDAWEEGYKIGRNDGEDHIMNTIEVDLQESYKEGYSDAKIWYFQNHKEDLDQW